MWVGYSPDNQVKSSRIGVTEEAVSVKVLSAAYESSPKEKIFIDRRTVTGKACREDLLKNSHERRSQQH